MSVTETKEILKYDDVVVMIPAYNPDEKFIMHLENLVNTGYKKIIVINDGSKKETEKYFIEAKEKYNCDIVTHNVNLGQGRAYKSGFNYYLGKYADETIGIIQCDCDGQHDIADVIKCTELLRENREKFILGVRCFDDKSIPFRSRFGNKCTSIVFKICCGLNISDTQTGLKGIPKSFIPRLMETPGERFEYASSVLLETKEAGVEILEFPIQTIYLNGNETSHFNPLLDSIRIYSLILKYLASSLMAFVVDIVAFSIFLNILKAFSFAEYIMGATYCAKIISCTYTFFVNKNLVFKSKGNNTSAATRFVILCIVQSTLSGLLTKFVVSGTGFGEVICKIFVDTLLFFVSFQVQNHWVFKKEK